MTKILMLHIGTSGGTSGKNTYLDQTEDLHL